MKRKNKNDIRGFGYYDKEMDGLQMNKKEYIFFNRLRNLALKLAFDDILNVYFHRILARLDELALSSNVDDCFVFLVETYECIEEEIAT